MKEKLTIVKVSGKIIEKPAELRAFVKAFAAIEGRKMLICSGDKMAQSVAERMRVKVKTINERPIVDDTVMNVLTMVYGGLINRQFVAKLQANKVNALGVTGADMNLMTSIKPMDNPLGRTGKVRQVNATALAGLLDAGIVPVFAPITHDGQGNLLFNETDAMAAEAAKALAVRYDVTLIYCFERNGVLLNPQDNDSVVAVLKRTQYKNLREMDIITDWFANKVDNAFSAIDHGVKEVIITNSKNLTDLSQGTHIKS